LTYNLFCIWFGVGSVAALIMSLLGFGVLAQSIAFTVVSALLLVLIRPLARRMTEARKTRTNADRVIGNEGVVIKEINPVLGEGQIKVIGQIWSARPEDGESVIAIDRRVEVTGITGVKVIVREKP
jgi:membrane protein implicated in regulation of membrane protease activity